MKDSYLLRAFYDSCWAILPERLEAIAEVLRLHAYAVQVHADVLASIRAQRPRRPRSSVSGNAVAVVPVLGILSQRAEMVEDISGPGGTSTERLGQRIADAVADPSVGSIVLDIDSPGGSVFGVQELGARIRAAGAEKPVVAVANSLAASAAYWIGSQATEFVATPGGEVGSIGVLAVHRDQSEAEAAAGIRTTIVAAGKYKAEANPHEPLSSEARAHLQQRVNDYYRAFIRAVARGRGVSESVVRNEFGQGRTVGAAEALSAGMVDRVETFDETVKRLSAGGLEAPRVESRSLAVPHSCGVDSCTERHETEAEAKYCEMSFRESRERAADEARLRLRRRFQSCASVAHN